MKVAVIETTKGTIRLQLHDDKTPKTCANFEKLAGDGFYDGLTFHRVIDDFMVQTGCPQGTGTGGSGQNLAAEFSDEPHVRGTASMARAASPNSADSQFFICFGDTSFLDGEYTVWGRVVDGMDNIDKLKRGEPVNDPDKIVSMRVAEDAE